MKKRIKWAVAGVAAFTFWGGAALAQDDMWEPQGQPELNEPQEQPSTEIETQPRDQDIATTEDDDSLEPVVVVADEDMKREDKKALGDASGLTVMLGGGVEGYTGGLAPRIDPGAAWGVTAAIKPTRVIGLELSYNGAANEVDASGGENLSAGPDIVRNGGQAALTVALTPRSVQPYLLGGFGISDYTVRGDAGAAGFSNDINTHIPVGAGLRTHLGDFTADARVNYSVLLNNDFASGVRSDDIAGVDASFGDARYTGSINLGTTF